MKRRKFLKEYGIILVAVCSLCIVNTSCTNSFEGINSDRSGVDPTVVDMASKLQQPLDNIIPPSEHRYQLWANLTSDIFAGYFMGVNDFGGSNNYNYQLRPSHCGTTYCDFYLNVIKYTKDYIPECKKNGFFELAAMLQIAQVYSLLPVVTTYGPVQYKCVKEQSESFYYDKEEDIYIALFAELKEAIQWLEDYKNGEKTTEQEATFLKADKLCKGDPSLWIRFANTLRLRIAMQLVKIVPELSKIEAEDAVRSGVLTMNDSDLTLGGGFKIRLIEDLWNDSRANANIICMLKGYGDPRLGKWFQKNEKILNLDDEIALDKNLDYVGVRQGVPMTRTEYQSYSKTSFANNSSRLVMRSAEAYFLRAEGALRGWEMKGTPRELYNDGIRSAFNSVGGYPDVEMYIEGMIPTEDFDWDKFEGGFGSAPYVNYRNQKYNCESLNRISIKWHEEDTNEQKLQRIITQKWIAVFPLSHVAWTEFRRTGYPKLLPIPDGLNKSNGKIDTDIQIRRLPYPEGEYNSNRMEVIKAVGMLKGEDNGGTRLWWDINKPNF